DRHRSKSEFVHLDSIADILRSADRLYASFFPRADTACRLPRASIDTASRAISDFHKAAASLGSRNAGLGLAAGKSTGFPSLPIARHNRPRVGRPRGSLPHAM